MKLNAPFPISPRWTDLRPRLISAGVMLVVGISAIWLGGLLFALLVGALCAAMLWELARMTAATPAGSPPILIAALGAVSLALTLWMPFGIGIPVGIGTAFLLLPAIAIALTKRRERVLATAWALAVMVAGFGLVMLRNYVGVPAILWIVLVVIASDVLGYFAGRLIGGPKFWPAISPKKTWSGTVAGWIGAMIVGAGFMAFGYAGWPILLLSPVVSFAGQMGDIAESWIKRRTGVKDSSMLIPGHGGFLDRFDAMMGAVAFLIILQLFVSLPLPLSSAVGG